MLLRLELDVRSIYHLAMKKAFTQIEKWPCIKQFLLLFYRFLMLVSTLDGKLSALNVRKEGLLEWSVSTGHGPLLSSSISNLEVHLTSKTHCNDWPHS